MIPNQDHDIMKDPTGSDRLVTKYLGEIVDVNDPLREGRCKVRVFSMFDTLPIEDIPWATQAQKPAFFGQDAKAGSISIPKKGAIVNVRFNSGDIYSQNMNKHKSSGMILKKNLRRVQIMNMKGLTILYLMEMSNLSFGLIKLRV